MGGFAEPLFPLPGISVIRALADDWQCISNIGIVEAVGDGVR